MTFTIPCRSCGKPIPLLAANEIEFWIDQSEWVCYLCAQMLMDAHQAAWLRGRIEATAGRAA